MSEKTIFSKIIDREIPGHFVYEDEHCVVLMDAFPSIPGQCMVIPRTPVNYFADLEPDLAAHLMKVAQRIAKASDSAFNTSRSCLVIEGYQVPHVHVILYPVSQASGITALNDVRTSIYEATLEEREINASKIKASLNS
jgi:histidine triad (HIT) family protein